MLLMALFAPWAANAQTTTVTVGTGTTSGYYAPIYTATTDYSYTQQLYTANEIGISGEFTSIGFEYTGPETKSFYVEIYMKHTNASDLTTQIGMSDAVLVYEGWYSVNGPGWVTVPLDQSFYYNGTSNLLIGVNKTAGDGYYNKAMWRCTSIQNMSRLAASDYPITSIDDYSGNMPINNYRPNVQLGMGPYIGTQVTVGTGTTSSYLAPIYSITNYSYTQQLYTAEEIGISGEIRGVGFEFTGTETKNFYVEIYMKPTNASDLSTQIDMTDAVLVYEGWYSVDGPGWVIVPFDQYYYHDGTKNLLIGVNRTSNEGVYNKAMWRCTPIQNMSRVAATDYPVSIDNYSGNMPINNYRPNVLLGIVPEPQVCEKPTGLHLESLYEDGFSIRWTLPDDSGIEVAYNIELNGVVVEEAYNDDYWDTWNTDVEPGTTYTVRIQRACTNYDVSEWSDPLTFTTPATTVTVGTGETTAVYAPIYTMTSYSYTQQLYTAEEIGMEGEIRSLFFDYDGETKSIDIEVYMKSVDASDLTEQIDMTDAVLVFDGTIFPINGWSPIAFDNSFYYDGTKNLLIGVNRTGGDVYDYGKWRFTYMPNMTRLAASDYPISIGNYSGNMPLNNARPNIQIGFIDANPFCPVPTGFDLSYPDDNTIVAVWNMDYSSYNIEVNGEVTEYINCPYVIYTEPNTTYTVRVQTVCDPGILSDWTEPIIYTTPSDTEWLTVNDSTATNSYTPIFGLWTDSYAKSQFIIPAADLADMTYGIINKLTFFSSNASINWGDAEFEVYLTEVDYTNFSSTSLIDWTNMTKVMNSGSLSINDNIMEFDFDNPYQYLGGNLMIGFCQTVSGTYGSCNWYGVTQTENTAIGGYENAKAISFQKFLPKTKFDFVMGEAPSCLKPNNLTINYNGGTEATLSWEGNANIYNIDVNGNVIEGIVGTTYSLTELELATIYNVKVQAVCDENDLSDWTFPVSFYTDLCVSGEQCEITFQLTDSYGDGWSGNAIKVVDAATGIVIATLANEDLDGTTGEETQTYTLPVCNGREIQFVWVPGTYPYEASYTVLDANGEEIFSGSGALSEPVNYTVDCSCPVPANFDLWYNQNIMASLTWDLGANAYNIEVNGEVTEGIAYAQTSNTTANYILNDLEAHTTYTVRLQAVCENGNSSEWTDPVTFTTTCEEYNVCGFNFEFICNSSAGFQDGYLEIIDVETGEQLWRLDTWDEGEEPLPWSLPEEFFVCTGREVQFVWWGPKTSDYTYALHDAGGEELASGYLSDLPFNFTANCEYVCETPTDLAIIDYEINYNQNDVAILSWDGGDGWASYYNISVNGEVIDTAGDNQYALDLEYNTTYEVRVQRVCYFTLTSEWSDPLVFTSMCDQYDEDGLCELNYSLIDENNNGFEEGVIEIIDVQTNAVVWHFIASDDFENEPYNQLDNEFFMCPGHEFRIVWDGPVGEGYRFVLYEPGGDDIATYPLSDLLIDMPPVTYTPNCEEQIIIQEVTMPAGTNWYSFEVNITLAELQAALVAAMDEAGVTVTPDNPIIIKTKDKTTRYNGSIWRGNLTVLAPNEMYMITLPGSGEIQLEGTAATPEEDLIIHYGTNWFVYPADQSEMTLNNAFAGFAVAGDKIKTKDATATCFGSFWRGNLTKIQPGENYIYESVVTEDRVLVFPTSK